MRRKRVTSELHDSYFRLMTIKHPISKIQLAIVWALSYYLTQLSLGCKSSCQQNSRQLETRCGREGHTRPRGPSENPDGVDPNIRRTRHNVTVITVGSKYEVNVRSPASCHMQTLKQPFRTLAIKWEVNIFEKKPSCVLSSCVFVLASVLILCLCDAEWWCRWLYNTRSLYHNSLVWLDKRDASSCVQNPANSSSGRYLIQNLSSFSV